MNIILRLIKSALLTLFMPIRKIFLIFKKIHKQIKPVFIESKNYSFNVAGVTFENRQEILREYYERSKDSFLGIITDLTLKPDVYNLYSDTAVKICINGNRDIGFIPEEKSREIKELIEREHTEYKAVGYIDWFTNENNEIIYYVKVELRIKLRVLI